MVFISNFVNKILESGKNISMKKEDRNMNTILKICLTFVIIGAINWGLVGLFDFNLVDYLFGEGSLLSRIIYVIVAISGIVDIAIYAKDLDR